MSNVICEHCGFQEMNSKLSAENKRLKARNAELEDHYKVVMSYYGKPVDYDTATDILNSLRDDKKILKDENIKLKKTLKECQELLEFLTDDNSVWCPGGADDLLDKINKLLGADR